MRGWDLHILNESNICRYRGNPLLCVSSPPILPFLDSHNMRKRNHEELDF